MKIKKSTRALLSKAETLFGLSAVAYLFIAVLSSLLRWRNYPDAIWIVDVARAIPTLRPWSFYRHVVVAPPLGSSVNYPPLFLLLTGFVFFLIWDSLRRRGFPIAAVSYAFLLLVAYFFGNPLWQLWVLIINVAAWGYVIFLLTRGKKRVIQQS